MMTSQPPPSRADRRDEAVQPRHGGHEARTLTKGSLCAPVRLRTEDPLSWMGLRSAEQFEAQAVALLGVREQVAPV
jgi:hypothetical protein